MPSVVSPEPIGDVVELPLRDHQLAHPGAGVGELATVDADISVRIQVAGLDRHPMLELSEAPSTNDFPTSAMTFLVPVQGPARSLPVGVAVVDLDDDVVLAVAGVVTATAASKMLVPSRITKHDDRQHPDSPTATPPRGAAGPDSFQLGHPVPGAPTAPVRRARNHLVRS